MTGPSPAPAGAAGPFPPPHPPTPLDPPPRPPAARQPPGAHPMILLVGFFVLVGRLLMALLLGLFYLARFLIHHPRAVAVLIVAGGVAWMAWPAFPAFADVPFPLLVGLGVAGGLVGLTVVVRGVLSDWNYERYLQ